MTAAPREAIRSPATRRRPRQTALDLHVLGAILVGGALGGLARAGLVEALPVPERGWPWATFIANIAGTFLLGMLVTRLQERLPPSTYRRPLLGTGFCGALTTFSTVQVEVLALGRDGSAGLAAAYLIASLAAGGLAIVVATALVRRSSLRMRA